VQVAAEQLVSLREYLASVIQKSCVSVYASVCVCGLLAFIMRALEGRGVGVWDVYRKDGAGWFV